MTLVTWAMMAALQTTHGHLEAFDMDLSDVVPASRPAVLIREIAAYRQPADPCQAFARTLGFAIQEDGVRLSDEDAPNRAHALALLLEEDAYELHLLTGPLAEAIGYDRSKQAQKDSSILAQLVELVGLVMQPTLDTMPEPETATMTAMRIRILAHRPAIAA